MIWEDTEAVKVGFELLVQQMYNTKLQLYNKWRERMPVVKVGRSRQVVIPKAIWEELGLRPGDYFEVEVEEDRIVFTPKRLVGREELWYWSKEGQAEIRQALAEVEQGQAEAFDDVEELIDDLRS